MTRTDELRHGGARSLGGGTRAPFVVWGDEYSWVEGRVVELWDGKHGAVARFRVTAASPNLRAQLGSDQEAVVERVESGQDVNVGLGYASLEGAIDDSQIGAVVHVAFERWEKTKSGQRFRQFTVLEIEPAPARDHAPEAVPDDYDDFPSGEPDDDLPF